MPPHANEPAEILPLPPYLWLWLAWYLILLPVTLGAAAETLRAALAPGPSALAGGELFAIMSLFEFFPVAIVLAGVVSLLLPRRRCQILEEQYSLGVLPPMPLVQEIGDLVRSVAPNLEVSGNLVRGDQLAFVYPAGFLTNRLALFGGLAKRWRGDPEGARAILLHELAHDRNRDPLACGAGSGFRFLVNHWFSAFALFVLAPVIVIYLMTSLSAFQDASFFLPPETAQAFLTSQVLTLLVPGVARIALSGMIISVGVLAAPILAIWSAELSADCAATGVQGSVEPLIRMLSTGSAPTSWWRWLLSRTTHPPVALRIAVLRSSPYQVNRTVLVLLFFPIAYLLALTLPFAFLITGGVAISWEAIAVGFAEAVRMRIPLFFAMALFVLVWPHLPVRRGRTGGTEAWTRAHHIAGGLVLAMAFVLLALLL